MPSYIVSTSYKHYIQSLCEAIDFPFNNTYCTELNIDSYDFPRDEIDTIMKWIHEIVKLPKPKIPNGAESIKDLTEEQYNALMYGSRGKIKFNIITKNGDGQWSGHRGSTIFLRSLLEHGLDLEGALLLARGVSQNLALGKGRCRLILPDDILQRYGVCRRRDIAGIYLLQNLKVLQDMGKLTVELLHLLLGEAQSGEQGDVYHLFAA